MDGEEEKHLRASLDSIWSKGDGLHIFNFFPPPSVFQVLTSGLRSLFRSSRLCDLRLLCDEDDVRRRRDGRGQDQSHAAVLAHVEVFAARSALIRNILEDARSGGRSWGWVVFFCHLHITVLYSRRSRQSKGGRKVCQIALRLKSNFEGT